MGESKRKRQREQGYTIPMLKHDPPLIKALVCPLLKASLAGHDKGGDGEHAERVIAVHRILCVHLAQIEDEQLRLDMLANIGAATASQVDKILANVRDIQWMEDTAGLQFSEILDMAAAEGVAERLPFPDDPGKDN
jgi:hypothetical protein